MTEQEPEAKPIDRGAEFEKARAALLDHLPKDTILAAYKAAGGQEVLSGKFSSSQSSAALVANSFGFFIDHPDLLALSDPILSAGSATSVSLEAQMRFPWSGGYHPWLDVAVETPNSLIGIESKRYEPFRDAKSAIFSAAYSRYAWDDTMKSFGAMRNALASQTQRFQFLDAAQLVKHAFGLRTQAVKRGKAGSLVYLYAEPTTYPEGRAIPPADKSEHRREISTFTDAVRGSGVLFHSISYAELLSDWRKSSSRAVRDHAYAIQNHFDV